MAVQSVGSFRHSSEVLDLAESLSEALEGRDVSCGKVAKVARGAGFDAKPSRRSMLVVIIPGADDTDERSIWIGKAILPLGSLLGASGDDYRNELRDALHVALTVDLGVEDVDWMVEEAWLASHPDQQD
ncbi:MAG: hypothetical protein ACR2PK_16885 [Acidimicrobiales bacterium]